MVLRSPIVEVARPRRRHGRQPARRPGERGRGRRRRAPGSSSSPSSILGGYYLDHAMARRATAAAAALGRLQARRRRDRRRPSCIGAAALGTSGPGPHAARRRRRRIRRSTAERRSPAQHGRRPATATESRHTPSRRTCTPTRRSGSRLDTSCGPGGSPAGRAASPICYELGFPEVARSLALAGARLLLVPAAFGAARARIWDVLTRARAIENGCYVAAAGQSGGRRRQASSSATAASSIPTERSSPTARRPATSSCSAVTPSASRSCSAPGSRRHVAATPGGTGPWPTGVRGSTPACRTSSVRRRRPAPLRKRPPSRS